VNSKRLPSVFNTGARLAPTEQSQPPHANQASAHGGRSDQDYEALLALVTELLLEHWQMEQEARNR
jgi:hypothetical protein